MIIVNDVKYKALHHGCCSSPRSTSEDLQRKGRISQVFCLGAVVTIRVTENPSNQNPS